jgi:hypothetical protein
VQGNKIFKRIFAHKKTLMRTSIIICLLGIISLSIHAQGYVIPAEIPFEKLEVQGNIHLELVWSDQAQLEFEGDTVPEELTIQWSNGVLALKNPLELKKSPAIKVKLYLSSLSGLEITRGSVVQSADVLKFPLLSIKADTGGKAEFTIETDSLYARVNQGSDVILSGSTRSQSIHAVTAGNFLGYELEAANTWVKASTGAQVKVNCTGYLNANIKSGAFLGYSGDPDHTDFKRGTGGKITEESP